MTTIISFTKPMSEFKEFFANGADVMESVDLSQCTDFWAKGANAELLIYSNRQIVYSCCYTEAYGMLFITSVWGRSGCAYEYKLNYDAIEKSLPVLSVENAKVGGFYKFCDSWMRVEKIYKVSEEYARKNDLWHRDRVKVIDFNDNQWEFALTNEGGSPNA